MSPAETEFLRAICSTFPRQDDPGTVNVNVAEIGRQFSLSEDASKVISRSLHRQGLLHLREIEGIALVHPTPAAKEQFSDQSFFRRLFQGLLAKTR